MKRKRSVFGLLVALALVASLLGGREFAAGGQVAQEVADASRLAWEGLENHGLSARTYRAKIPGGWLLTKNSNDAGITFVPDSEHTWDGSTLPR